MRFGKIKKREWHDRLPVLLFAVSKPVSFSLCVGSKKYPDRIKAGKIHLPIGRIILPVWYTNKNNIVQCSKTADPYKGKRTKINYRNIIAQHTDFVKAKAQDIDFWSDM